MKTRRPGSVRRDAGSRGAARNPVHAERPVEELVGDLEGPVATVSADGTVEPVGSPWRVGWAVGAEDRWHVAAEEAAVRTRLVDDMPVVATAMKVPGGDVVQQVAAVTGGAGRGVVVEFVNETPVPVSLALAVSGSVKRAGVRGSQLLVGDQTAVELGRVPGGAAAVSDGQVWNEVRSGPPPGDCKASSRVGLAAAVTVFPLARRVPLRVYLPADGGASVLGSPAEVAAGWQAMVARAASAELPDGTAARAWRRSIAASILAAGGAEPEAAARAAIVLDRVGLPDEADRARAVVADAVERSRPQPEVAVVALRALASRRLRTGRDSGLAERAGPLAAARDAHRLLVEIPRDSAPRPAAGEGLAAAVRDAITFGGDGLTGIEAALDCLAAEAPDHLVVLPALPSDWKGAPLDVRGLATRHGLLSFSVRWHGSRPALLWELVPPTQRPSSPVAVRCGLDQSWRSEAPAGEALLEPGTTGA